MRPVLFEIAGREVFAYGLFLGAGFFCGMWLASWMTREDGRYPKDFFYSFGVLMILGGVIGGRLEYVRANPERFAADWSRVLEVTDGGLVFHGGLIVAALLGALWAWRAKLSVLKVFDVCAVTVPLGVVFARTGCFLGGCCFGRPSDLPWSVVFTDPDSRAPLNVALHPTQLYELSYCLVLLAGLFWLWHRRPRPGAVVLAFFSTYPFLRVLNETFRGDPQRGYFLEDQLGSMLTNGQAIFGGVGVMALVLWVFWLRAK